MYRSDAIKELFLGTHAVYSLDDAANLLGWTTERLAAELSSQFLVSREHWRQQPVPSSAVAVLAFPDWSYETIEEVLGPEMSLLPPLVRLTELTVRLPAHQIAALEAAAIREQTSVNDILARQLMDLTCAEAPALASSIAGFREALHWPAREDWAREEPGLATALAV